MRRLVMVLTVAYACSVLIKTWILRLTGFEKD
jgi:hypothetical protein